MLPRSGSVVGKPWPERNAEISSLLEARPEAAEHLGALEAWMAAPGPVLPMLEAILPFNFH
jgi:hypothetical protein